MDGSQCIWKREVPVQHNFVVYCQSEVEEEVREQPIVRRPSRKQLPKPCVERRLKLRHAPLVVPAANSGRIVGVTALNALDQAIAAPLKTREKCVVVCSLLVHVQHVVHFYVRERIAD